MAAPLITAARKTPTVTMKRIVDVLLSATLLLLLLPVSLLVALLIRLDSRGPVLVRMHRVGRHGRMLKVWEFRTSIADPEAMETIAGCEGEQITRIGGWLRRVGIARWPLLLSVLTGQLAMVGPRVELPRYVGCYPGEVRKRVLSVKPGLVDGSTMAFRDEQKILHGLEGDALEEAYVEKVLPVRLDHAQRYLDKRGLVSDLSLLLSALLSLPLRMLK